MQKAAVFSFVLVLILSGCGESATGDGGAGGTAGTGGMGGTPPPPPAVDQTCRDWCANEPEGPSCHQGPFESVQPCYEACLRDYQREAERQCGDEWIAIYDCQLDLDCEDLFGDCDSIEDEFDECVRLANRLANNRAYCEANCPDFDIMQCEQDTTECRQFAQANSFCATNCAILDRQECIAQYIATGRCGSCVSPPFSINDPDLLSAPLFRTDAPNGQAMVSPGELVEGEIAVSGATRRVLAELSDFWADGPSSDTAEYETPGSQVIQVALLSPDRSGRFYMRVTLCGSDCDALRVIFSIDPQPENGGNATYERVLIENGVVVQTQTTCLGFGAQPGMGSGTVLVQQ